MDLGPLADGSSGSRDGKKTGQVSLSAIGTHTDISGRNATPRKKIPPTLRSVKNVSKCFDTAGYWYGSGGSGGKWLGPNSAWLRKMAVTREGELTTNELLWM